MKKRSWWIVGGVAAAGLAVAGWAVVGRGDRNLPRVTTTHVGRQQLVSRVTCNGKVQARRKVELSANISGQIVNLAVREGDRVKKGDFMMQIDRVSLQASADSSQAALQALLSERDASRANLERNRIEFERSQASYDSEIISKLDYDRARTNYDASRATLAAVESRIEEARGALAGARDTLSKTTILAPIDGVVTRLSVEEGEVAVIGTMNNPGTVLMTISDLAIMEAVMEVDETDVPQVSVGQKAVLLVDAYRDSTFDGTVTEVGSSPIAQAPGTTAGIDFEVKIRIEDPPAGLKPGLSVTADIVTGARDDVVAVPLQALVLRDREDPGRQAAPEEEDPQGAKKLRATTVAARGRDQEGVFVLEKGVAHFTPIATGITGELDIEALSGVADGAEIITGPFRVLRTLKDGDKVLVEKAAPEKS
ncbi:MAG: efflux RND transporter periplasmic adaptor subunit [Candidatus Polarisedimenticolia bacterium]